MSGFKDALVAVEPELLKKLISQVEANISNGWIRDTGAEEWYAKEVPDYTMFCFACNARTHRKAARLWMPYQSGILEVSNIVPSETSELSHAQYNFILEEFYRSYLLPPCKSLGLDNYIGGKSKRPRWAKRDSSEDANQSPRNGKSDAHQWSVEDQISDIQVTKPHVVILGAGASVAAFPKGDKSGRKLPVMKDFIKVLGLQPTLKKHGIKYRGNNFEILYSRLCGDPKYDEGRRDIEDKIRSHFSSLSLPDHPTLYDHLVLSLRAKDMVATFNWDPFLWQACDRNCKFAEPPEPLFLHGSVAVGTDMKTKTQGPAGQISPKSGKYFEPTPILFPITKKDYNQDPAIKMSWDCLQSGLRRAYLLTVFGYAAPKSDVEAKRLMKEAWGDVEDRQFEETELIDIVEEDLLIRRWSPFIHTHHRRVSRDLYTSTLGHHPRRSCEAVWNQLMMCKWPSHNNLPKETSFDELYRWLTPLVEAEKK